MKKQLMMGLGIAALALLTPFAVAQTSGGNATYREIMKEPSATYLPLAKSMIETAGKYDGPKGSPLVQGPWYRSKQFGSMELTDVRPPETRPFAIDDKECGWELATYADAQIHPLKMGGKSTFYFARTVKAEKDMPLKFGIGSDDSFEFFFDGKKVKSVKAGRGVTPNNDWVNVNLKGGQEHMVILKIYNIGGDAGFYYNPAFTYPTQALWNDICKQYPAETGKINNIDGSFGPRWLMATDDARPEIENDFVKKSLPANLAAAAVSKDASAENLAAKLATVEMRKLLDNTKTQLRLVSIPALLKAVDDLKSNHPGALADIDNVRKEVVAYEPKLKGLAERLQQNDLEAVKDAKALCDLQKKVVFAVPAVKALNDILVVKRSTRGGPGLPANWQGNTSMGKHYDNEFGILNFKDGSYRTMYKPENRGFVGDIDMHFDAKRFLFSSISPKGRWQIFEMNVDGTGFRQVTADTFSDVDNYEAMYLPDERIIFTSSATFLGVPCVAGSDYVGNIHIMDKNGNGIRRLCFDQDNNWCPVLLEDGRVLYLRWEYTDSAHYFSRILMHMNPDGTGQNEFYGSNSYWPNSMFYARPLPGSTTQFVAIVTGHHGNARSGELYLFDINKGREETQGVVQQIKPHNVQNSSLGIIKDQLVDNSWPKFIYPHPLSDKQFLVSAKPTPQAEWGLYLIDTFDNMTLIDEQPGFYLFEPTPIAATKRPPIIPDKIDPKQSEATVFIQDVYEGTGLQGVPRGTVKALRIFQYEYSYRNMGGHYAIGMESGWDVRRVIGNVPVYEDGSANFIVPANTPFAIQPLDAEGKALQQMRSWTVGMPGENVQCVGCHERQNQTVSAKRVAAATKAPSRPTPFYGPKRGFSYDREIQPILNRYCVQCHNSGDFNLANTEIDKKAIDKPWSFTGYSYSYWALHPFVRRNGPEGNYKILIPGEFHANTSELVQMLRKGHHGVKLDQESWDKINTWIDLNVPFYGTWTEIGIPKNFEDRRREMRALYSSVTEDIERVVKGDPYDQTPVRPSPDKSPRQLTLTAKNWPFSEAQAAELQKQAGGETMKVDLGEGQTLTFVRIPAGEFNMGSVSGAPDEWPLHTVKIDKPFWMATTPVTLGQYRTFDPTHTNYVYDQHYKDQVRPGYHMDMKEPKQGVLRYYSMEPTPENYQPNNPAIRVNWLDATAFCKWLGEKSGKKVALPTEAQWEWACRAGTATPMWFGDLKADFGKFANLADVSLKKMAVSGVDPVPINNPSKYFDFLPKIATVNDGYLHLSPVGTYKANPFGLFDMHGNVSEWCRDNYRPYPYKTVEADGSTVDPSTVKSVRGGSWYNRPYRATSSFRLDYPAWQKVFDVGFRPIIEE